MRGAVVTHAARSEGAAREASSVAPARGADCAYAPADTATARIVAFKAAATITTTAECTRVIRSALMARE